MLRSLTYNIKQGFTQIFRNRGMSLASIFSITAMLLILGLFFVIMVNVNMFTEAVKQDYDQIEVFLKDDTSQEEIMNIKNGFNFAKKVISTGAGMVVVLDEILGLLDLHLISKTEISDMLAAKPSDVTVIMTGRVIDDGIRGMADEIYNITPEK